MIRPENISILGPGAPRDRDNLVEGRAEDTILLGSAVKHLVRLADDTLLTVHESNGRHRSQLRAGEAVTLGWDAGDLLVLEAREKRGTS